MRRLTRVSLAIAGSAALIGSVAFPASAADTTVTVTVEGGALSISAPETMTLAAAAPTFVDGAVVNAIAVGTLKGVTVTDLNADGLGWSSSIALPVPFTFAPEAVPTFIASDAVASDGAIVTKSGGTQTAVSAVNNTATWNVDVSVTIPEDVLADGVHTGVFVSSVS